MEEEIKVMVKRIRKKKRMIGFSISLIFLILLFFIIFYTGRVPLTGFFVFDPEEPVTGENNSIIASAPANEEPSPSLTEESNVSENVNNGSITVNQSINYHSSKNYWEHGGETSFRGYNIIGLDENMMLWVNGYFLNPDDLLNGFFRFSLYSNESRISDFDLNVNHTINLSNLTAGTDISEGKAFLYNPDFIENIDLYIPRKKGQDKVRICENASSFEQIYEGCINDPEVINEYVLDINNSDLELTGDEEFFIIKNLKKAGGKSEGDNIFESEDVITLISPVDNAGDRGNESLFYYNISPEFNVDYCKLLVDDVTLDVSYDVSSLNKNLLSAKDLKRGQHYWKVSCTDIFGNISNSEKRRLTIIPPLDYLELPDDINNIDIENVENLYLKSPGFGLITFIESVNLSGVENVSEYVVIRNNFISIDSKNLPQFNKSAVLTFFEVDFENPVILRNGKPCPDCQIISNENGGLMFSVSHFSNYSASENSQLEIWDDTDNNKVSGGYVGFYINYTNVSDNEPITGGTCVINFSDNSSSLSYNSDSKLFEYNRSFSGAGVYYYNVSCSASGFTSLNLTDYVSVDSNNGPLGANFTEILTEETNVTHDPESFDSYAGNVTELSVSGFSTTQSWQGYYGNVTGVIELADGGGNMMYNWSETAPTGEVYASRASDVNFATIGCAGALEISLEETALSQSSDDSDSVTNTFNKKDHDEFNVGNVNIGVNSCNSTNIYGSFGPGADFSEVLLADDASNMVYTSLLEDDVAGFNGKIYDFEMIVGEDGHNGDIGSSTYYFYMEVIL